VSEKVLAATQISSRKVELREYPMPEISADDALLKIEIAGICGSDIGGYEHFEGAPRIRVMRMLVFSPKLATARRNVGASQKATA